MGASLEDKVFVVNKPVGPTSFGVVDAFRRATGVRKVGHTGTLDPLAEGVLLLCTGRATRAVENFMDLPKVYECTEGGDSGYPALHNVTLVQLFHQSLLLAQLPRL